MARSRIVAGCLWLLAVSGFAWLSHVLERESHLFVGTACAVACISLPLFVFLACIVSAGLAYVCFFGPKLSDCAICSCISGCCVPRHMSEAEALHGTSSSAEQFLFLRHRGSDCNSVNSFPNVCDDIYVKHLFTTDT